MSSPKFQGGYRWRLPGARVVFALAACLSTAFIGCQPNAPSASSVPSAPSASGDGPADSASRANNDTVPSQASDNAAEEATKSDAQFISVDVEIRVPDGARRTIKVDRLPRSSTVGDVMQRLAASQEFADIELSGSGERMFVPAIGEHKTSGGEGWLYELNGKWAKQGIGTQRINDGDKILWKYGTY